MMASGNSDVVAAAPPAFHSYDGFVMAAPMVRISVLGYRLFAARCGSDVVFSEELVAAKLAKCTREERPLPEFLVDPSLTPDTWTQHCNSVAGVWDLPVAGESCRYPLGTRIVEFVRYEPFNHTHRRALVFSTIRLPEAYRRAGLFSEGKPCILQMGVADPEIGAKAAALVADDVDGFDVNMGCPKKFSVVNGMGAKLMEEPERASAILSAIRRAIGPTKPFSFKTRVFEEVDKSVSQLTKCLSTGAVHSVTLHARTRPQKSETKPRVDLASEVVKRMKPLFPHIAFIYNGSLGCSGLDGGGDLGPAEGVAWGGKAQLLATVRALGFDGGLVARDAMWNPTVLLSAAAGYSDDYVSVHRRMLEYHAHFGTSQSFLKYHLTRTFGQGPLQAANKQMYREILQAKCIEQFAVAFGIDGPTARVWQDRHGAAEGDLFTAPDEEARPSSAVAAQHAADAGMKRVRSANAEAALTAERLDEKPPQPVPSMAVP
jgi:tRNA-dihydrouridine synthase 2